MTFSKQSVSYWIQSHQFLESDIVYDVVKVVVDYFESPLLENNCNLNFLKEEFEILHDHVKRCLQMFVREMLAHYFLNRSGIRDQKFITRY